LTACRRAVPVASGRVSARILRDGSFDARAVSSEITDTGLGIAPEHLPRVFDPFFTTKPVGEGIGLGLSVYHGAIAAMGGRITIESTLDVGTTVRISMPTR
jgi:signal transduction histidine kinase